jgi:hypothetical protein
VKVCFILLTKIPFWLVRFYHPSQGRKLCSILFVQLILQQILKEQQAFNQINLLV